MNNHDPKYQHREKEVEGGVDDGGKKRKSERKLIKRLKMLDEMRVWHTRIMNAWVTLMSRSVRRALFTHYT